MKGVLIRALKLAALLNLPPILLLLMAWLELTVFPIVLATMFWFSIPLQYLGIASLFDHTQISVNEWGISSSSPAVLFTVVLFWVVMATIISYLSLLRISRTAK